MEEVACRVCLATKQPADEDRDSEVAPDDGQVKRVGAKRLQGVVGPVNGWTMVAKSLSVCLRVRLRGRCNREICEDGLRGKRVGERSCVRCSWLTIPCDIP